MKKSTKQVFEVYHRKEDSTVFFARRRACQICYYHNIFRQPIWLPVLCPWTKLHCYFTVILNGDGRCWYSQHQPVEQFDVSLILCNFVKGKCKQMESHFPTPGEKAPNPAQFKRRLLNLLKTLSNNPAALLSPFQTSHQQEHIKRISA